METTVILLGFVEAKGVPTRWGNQLNGNSCRYPVPTFSIFRPHSLGKPIEWKQREAYKRAIDERKSPHSLGKPIEWKLKSYRLRKDSPLSPHSLGKPIEWKLDFDMRTHQIFLSPLAGETN